MSYSAIKFPIPLKGAIKAAVAIGLILWIIKRGALDFSLMVDLISIPFLSICVMLVGLNLYFMSERWRMLVRAQTLDLGVWQAFRLSLIGNFFNFAMPGSVGGDLIKGYYIARRAPNQKMIAGLSVLVDRLIGFYAMIIMAVLVMTLQWQWVIEDTRLQWLLIGLITAFTGFTAFFALAFSKVTPLMEKALGILGTLPGGELALRVYRSLHVYGSSMKSLLLAMLLSLAAQMTAVVFFWWVGHQMGLGEIGVIPYLIVIPLGFIVSALPIAPAGIGVGQAAFLFFFNLVLGFPSKLGPTAITLFQIMLFAYGVIGAILYLRQKNTYVERLEPQS